MVQATTMVLHMGLRWCLCLQNVIKEHKSRTVKVTLSKFLLDLSFITFGWGKFKLENRINKIQQFIHLYRTYLWKGKNDGHPNSNLIYACCLVTSIVHNYHVIWLRIYLENENQFQDVWTDGSGLMQSNKKFLPKFD